ncbi:hypothetical protein [Tritonibacter litoralis]|nr:hypothetical protein [Tritonibacter litoralis]
MTTRIPLPCHVATPSPDRAPIEAMIAQKLKEEFEHTFPCAAKEQAIAHF